MQIVKNMRSTIYHKSAKPWKKKQSSFKNPNLLNIVVSVLLETISGKVAFLPAFVA